jgi:hypothetical protein
MPQPQPQQELHVCVRGGGRHLYELTQQQLAGVDSQREIAMQPQYMLARCTSV